MSDVSAVFAEHLRSSGFADLPAPVVAATKRSILDTLGVVLAGSGLGRVPDGIVRLVRRWGGRPESTVLGYNLRVPAPHAAFANGAMAHQLDFDDTHDAAVAHPTANSLTAALALAESQGGRPGSELIRAVALANDLVCRLGLAIQGTLYDYPWTRPPVIGVYGAAAAAAVMLDLSPEQIESAFGLTLHQTGNTLECVHAAGSDVRGLRDGFSARNGVTAACLAAEGVRGDRAAFEGRFGLFNAYFRGEYDRERLTRDLGRVWEGAAVSIKPWPSARETHATIHAALELRARERLEPGDIAEVLLRVGKTNLEFCEPASVRRRPPGQMEALSSLPYAVAVALRHGAVPLEAYTDSGRSDPAVLALAERVRWELSDEMGRDGSIEGGHVEVRLRDGRTVVSQARHGLGHPDNPLSEAQLLAKARDCARFARRPLDREQVEALARVVFDLEGRTTDDLVGALTVAGPWEG